MVNNSILISTARRNSVFKVSKRVIKDSLPVSEKEVLAVIIKIGNKKILDSDGFSNVAIQLRLDLIQINLLIVCNAYTYKIMI